MCGIPQNEHSANVPRTFNEHLLKSFGECSANVYGIFLPQHAYYVRPPLPPSALFPEETEKWVRKAEGDAGGRGRNKPAGDGGGGDNFTQ